MFHFCIAKLLKLFVEYTKKCIFTCSDELQRRGCNLPPSTTVFLADSDDVLQAGALHVYCNLIKLTCFFSQIFYKGDQHSAHPVC